MAYVHVRVTTKARKEEVKLTKPDHLEIKVREKAERNQANARVIEILSEYFNVPVKKIKIINGHHSPSKLFSVEREGES